MRLNLVKNSVNYWLLGWGVMVATCPILGQVRIAKRPLVFAGSRLEVVIRNAPEGVDWVVAVKAEPGVSAFGAFSTSELSAPNRFGIREPGRTADASPGTVSISHGSVNVDMRGDVRTGLSAYLEVPPGTRVKLTHDGAIVADTPVAESLLVRSGVVLADPVRGRPTAVLHLPFPPRPAVAGLTRRPDGYMWASTEELKRHALAKPVPPPLSPAAQLRTVTFLVRIDRTGAVVEVVQALGDSAVVEALRNAVMNWRFSPLVSGGSPVEVRAVLPFHVSAGGVVTAGL